MTNQIHSSFSLINLDKTNFSFSDKIEITQISEILQTQVLKIPENDEVCSTLNKFSVLKEIFVNKATNRRL